MIADLRREGVDLCIGERERENDLITIIKVLKKKNLQVNELGKEKNTNVIVEYLFHEIYR